MIQEYRSWFDQQSVPRIALMFVFVALLSFFSIGKLTQAAVDQNESPWGGADFHSYWFSGHFVREGINPYTAYRMKMEPGLPVSYIDGRTDREAPVGEEHLWRTPAQLWVTYLLAPFAWLSWPNARNLWTLFNLAAVIATPLLLMRILPEEAQIKPLHIVIIILLFALMGGVRETIFRGQTSLLIIPLLLLAILWMDEYPLPSGIALGIALSKISLVFPFILLFLWRRKYIPLATAAVVYILGLGLAALMAGDGLGATWQVYFKLLAGYNEAARGGIHLPAQFDLETRIGAFPASAAVLPGWTNGRLLELASIAAGVLLMLLLLLLHPGLLRGESASAGPRLTIAELELLTIFTLINLVTAYHSFYDTAIVLLLFPLLFIWWHRLGGTRRTNLAQLLFLILVLAALILLLLPQETETFLVQGFELEGLSPLVWEPLTLTLGLLLALLLALIMTLVSKTTAVS